MALTTPLFDAPY